MGQDMLLKLPRSDNIPNCQDNHNSNNHNMDNFKEAHNHMANKDTIHSNQCMVKDLDNLAMVNLQCSQVMDNLLCNQGLDNQAMDNHQCNQDLDKIQDTDSLQFNQVMDNLHFNHNMGNNNSNQGMVSLQFNQVLDSLLCSQIMDSHHFNQIIIKVMVNQDMDNLQSNSKDFHLLNLFKVSMGITPNSSIMHLYKDINLKLTASLTIQWNGVTLILIQEHVVLHAINAEEILQLLIGSIIAILANQICARIVENQE